MLSPLSYGGTGANKRIQRLMSNQSTANRFLCKGRTGMLGSPRFLAPRRHRAPESVVGKVVDRCSYAELESAVA